MGKCSCAESPCTAQICCALKHSFGHDGKWYTLPAGDLQVAGLGLKEAVAWRPWVSGTEVGGHAVGEKWL